VNDVLIVDDNPLDVALHERVLQRTGMFGRIWHASNGLEAIDMFCRHEQGRADAPEGFPPLIVLLDLNMPLLDGFGFLERCAALPKGVRSRVIIVLSSSSAKLDRERIADSEMVAEYLVKPLSSAVADKIARSFIDDPVSRSGDGGRE